MRVCMVAYSFYDGDNRVLRYAETLAKRGDDVEVVSLRYGSAPRAEVLNGVTVFRIQARTGKEESRALYLARTVLFTLRAMALVTRRHLKNPYQLAHVHSVPDFLVLAAWVLRLAGCKIVLDIHDLLPEFYASRFNGLKPGLAYRTLLLEERLSVAMADYVILPNHLWFDRVVERSAKRRNCTVILNAVDRSIFSPGAKKPPDKKFVVLYPGSLNWHQGVDVAIRAVSLLKDRAPQLELLICGLGPERTALGSLARDLGLDGRVRFLDPRPIRDVALLMRSVDLGVVPKRKDSFGNEAFSTKVLEFMASGVPVLVSDTKIDKFYYDESLVQFFHSGDPQDLAEKLIDLMCDVDRRDTLVRNAAAFAGRTDWDATKGLYLDLVDGLVERAGLSAGNGRAKSVAPVGPLESTCRPTTATSTDEAPAARTKAAVADYYRCPEDLVTFEAPEMPRGREGYFQFGPDAVCYGTCSTGPTTGGVGMGLYDCSGDEVLSPGSVRLPFDPASAIENVRMERYRDLGRVPHARVTRLLRDAYYLLRPITPSPIRTRVQRMYYRGWRQIGFPRWPVDLSVDKTFQSLLQLLLRNNTKDGIPFIWFWPEGYSSCAMMTHDIETKCGQEFCPELMDLDDSFGIRAAFQVIPEKRYPVTDAFLDRLRNRGYEINVHDLNHDGRLFRDRQTFLDRVQKINAYVRAFGAEGFRAGAMYRRPEWFDALEVAYDMSVPNVGHMEPQQGGCCTIMPYFVNDRLLELPLTTTQDFAVFHVLRQNTISLWKEQIARISAGHGLISFIVHPDYVMHPREKRLYAELLAHLSTLRTHERLWIALPGEINEWWRKRAAMRLVQQGEQWTIEGAGSERARLAYARLRDGRLTHEVQSRLAHSSIATA